MTRNAKLPPGCPGLPQNKSRPEEGGPVDV
jgi:hypothetical protein